MANKSGGGRKAPALTARVPTAVCKWCGNDMVTGGSCGTFMEWGVVRGKRVNVVRIAYPIINDKPCHDCGVAPGAIHHAGCDTEVCGFCGEQAIGCSHD